MYSMSSPGIGTSHFEVNGKTLRRLDDVPAYRGSLLGRLIKAR